ncbi:M20/M25/M40 family metallo-hydrolase [Archaeoglobus profundus]|uniref:Peptidase M20 n=1 Tax=Archaeoglobus profundus (strain DSM 5631 / JCM 9629 / NBRC 100127 / Av18) TaxID=572546 RepID=D2RDB3_ARCPA|nr:M20/M25/M40 family metallo-hydrolase [Archaeoglobus profundus]ADB58107.1 peptidase M20 [Archaeoglobus profundus DSM 5631]
MRALSILRELVEIESESGEEDEIISHLIETLYDFEPAVFEKYNTKNILINQDADVWVVTHVDTVPVKRGFEFDGVYAYGTGCCDAKASITAIILALEEVEEPNFGVALLSDEEEGGLGSKAVVEEFGKRRAIVMEPTELKIANRHYGCLEVDVELLGESAHGAFPDKGINAIEKAIDAINRVKSLNYLYLLQRIEGGSYEYVVPDKCSLRIDLLIPPEEDVNVVERELIEIFKNEDVAIVEKAQGFVSGGVTALVESAVKRAGLHVDYTEMRSWTDAINFREAGWDVVVFGPGELHLCHTEKERIRIDEILKAKDVLVALNEIIQSSS